MLKKHLRQLNRRHLFNILLLALVAYAAVATLGVIGRNFVLQQRVDELTEEIETLDRERQELEHRIIYYQTDAFVEREAREKLGLKAPGEQVVIFPDKVPAVGEALAEELTQAEVTWSERSIENWRQWLYFLFRIEPA